MSPSELTLQDAERQAVRLASGATIHDSFGVYLKGGKAYACSAAARPPASACHCIVQRWDNDTVQIRRDNAGSDWVGVIS